ncbi:reverse transcriptase domain-containing protein [Tanacetum coccineum]
MLKSLLSNKVKLIELANAPLNENCSTVILKKLPKKLGDAGKFLIPCSFSELKCKALADLGASINFMPLSVWKNLGLLELISTQMTLKLANRAICTPKGIARDVFVLVGKFTFPADFVIVDSESDPRAPLILGRPFLQTACALIDVHKEEMIIRDGKEIKDSKILIDELDPPRSSDFLPFPECDLAFYEDFSEVDALSSTNNEDKGFNPGILIHKSHFEVTNCKTMEKNVKRTTNASLILEDFNPPLYELPCSYGEDIRVLDVPCLHFYTP